MNSENDFDEVRGVRDAADGITKQGASIAAFFDLDGTLLPFPSLEKRFFHVLRYRRAMAAGNYLFWLAEAMRLLPRGIKHIAHANKMYLRGVRSRELGYALAGQGADEKRIAFYPGALERLAWHAKRNHAIVIVSGTLQPLAVESAAALEAYLTSHGIRTNIGVYATRLEMRGEKWTGRIAGEAMLGEAKAHAIKEIAASRHFDLEMCFAYGDSASDRFMLESVGRPTAVNPSNDLVRIAARNNWPIIRWSSRRRWEAKGSLSLRAPTHAEAATQELRMHPSKAGTCS